jgi:hypothetical protein
MRVARQAAPRLVGPRPPENLHQPRGARRLPLDLGGDQPGLAVGIGVISAEDQTAVEPARLVEPLEVVPVPGDQDPPHPCRVVQDGVVGDAPVRPPGLLGCEDVVPEPPQGQGHVVVNVLVRLTSQWQEVRVPWDHFRHFAHWAGPDSRGRPGDLFHPENLSAVNLCFGAWLFPATAERRHAVEIESICLDR